jgi:dephospho-CoA kinase
MTTMDAEHYDRAEPVRNRSIERTGSFCARKALVLGLTGGVATGKTTVARMLEDLGARVVSADEIVHQMLKSGSPVRHEVVEEFGAGIVKSNGDIDRAALGDIVFRDAEKRARLEAIIHPPVLNRLAEEADGFRSAGDGVLVLEIPLLVEKSAFGLVDKVLVVTAEQETQVRRLEKRSKVTREEAILRVSAQYPMSEKVKYADWVVNTEGALRSTKAQVSKVWHDIQKLLAQAQ